MQPPDADLQTVRCQFTLTHTAALGGFAGKVLTEMYACTYVDYDQSLLSENECKPTITKAFNRPGTDPNKFETPPTTLTISETSD